MPPVAFPPEPIGAYVGQDLDPELSKKIAKEGARTVPGREHGGNCDVGLLRVLQIPFRRLMLVRLQRSRIFQGALNIPVLNILY